MFKPKPEWCTVKRKRVNPLKKDEPCYVLRKGTKFFMLKEKK